MRGDLQPGCAIWKAIVVQGLLLIAGVIPVVGDASSFAWALEILTESFRPPDTGRLCVRVTLHLPQGAAAPIHLLSHIETPNGPHYDPFTLFLLNRRTEKEYRIPLSGPRDASTRAVMRLVPGEDLVHLIELNRWLHAGGSFLPEGIYALRCSYGVDAPVHPQPSRRSPHQTAATPSRGPVIDSGPQIMLWTGRIVSPPIEINIGPGDRRQR